MKIANLTSHGITLESEYMTLTIQPHGGVARINRREYDAGELFGFAIKETVSDGIRIVDDLGDPVNNVSHDYDYYIVSSYVLNAIKAGTATPQGLDPSKFIAPNTAYGVVRDSEGRVV
ncbi:MAG: hypothetical protein ACRCZZ_05475, partial [Phocaeicola sp.]